MKKILTLALALIMVCACFVTTASAAEPQKLTLDLATDVTINPSRTEESENQVNGKNSSHSTLVDGKIVMEYNGESDNEQWARSVLWFEKQIPTATYKFMVVDIKFGDATLVKYDGTANPEGTFDPHIQVGYVASDLDATPTKWVSVDASTGAIVTTSETPDAFMNDTFAVSNVKDKTIQLLITLPSDEAAGYDQYLNMFYINPFGWAMGATNNITVEISGISFYDVNPFIVDENDNQNQNGGENNTQTPGQDENTGTGTNTSEVTDSNVNDTSATTDVTAESGCGSVIGGSALILIAITGVTIVAKKKKED